MSQTRQLAKHFTGKLSNIVVGQITEIIIIIIILIIITIIIIIIIIITTVIRS